MENTKRYAALFLFQFRTIKNGIQNKKRVCEERIILFESESAKKALGKAKERGKNEEFSYLDNGAEIFFEFVGIMEFVELGASLEEDEVWYRLVEKNEPMEKRNKIIPKEGDLNAFMKKKRRKKGRILVP